jgi:ParB-like chromosome segregation protein Spo0J
MQTIALNTLEPNDRNPRKITDEALQKLCESIERDPQFMELRPIVVDENNVILGGNQRYRACRKLGKETVPASWVKVATGLTEEQRKRFIIVDNGPEGMSGDWDAELLKIDWDVPELADVGLDLQTLLGDLALNAVPESNKPIDEGAMSETDNECPKCGFKW